MIKAMKDILLFTVILVTLCFPAFTTQANNAQQDKYPTKKGFAIKADYAVYASGFRALAATAHIQEEQLNYATYVTIKTDGLLGTLAPWRGVLTSTGRFDEISGVRMPTLHSFDNIWRGKNNRVEQHYDNAGRLIETRVKEDGRPDEIKTPDPTLVDGTTDILSAALEASRIIQKSGSCNSSQPVYDGKRRFNLVFKEQSRETIKTSKYTSFDGEAIKCVVEIEPDGGKWRDKPRGWMSIQEQSKKKGTPPLVWFGRVTQNSAVYLPVRLQVKTNYGTLILHMKDAEYKILE